MEQVGNVEFDRKELLGNGAFAIVYSGRCLDEPYVKVAVKEFDKRRLAKTKAVLTNEIKVLKKLSTLKHENLVSLLKYCETDRHVYLVMEYCNGGDLMDYLGDRLTLEEDNIQHFLKQIVRGMEAMFKNGIVHRDLKPANILLCKKSNIPHFSEIIVKIADFGFSRFITDGAMVATVCGSPMYMAPEVIMGQEYGAKADLWSIGSIIFQCLTGCGPFMAKTQELLRNFYDRSEHLVPNIPKECSEELKDLLFKLLKKSPLDRISFEDFFIHQFLTMDVSITPSKRILEEAAVQLPSQKIVIPQSPINRNPVRKIVAPEPVKLPKPQKIPSKMQESNDFTFLPPRAPVVKKIQPQSKPKPNPVPVPSQRLTHHKMKEQLEASQKRSAPSPVEKEPKKAAAPMMEPTRKTALPEPNAADVEKLTVPQPNFIICEVENGNFTAQKPPTVSIFQPTSKPIRAPSQASNMEMEQSIKKLGRKKPTNGNKSNPFLMLMEEENEKNDTCNAPNSDLELLDLPLPFASPTDHDESYSTLRNTSLDSNLIPSPMRLGFSVKQDSIRNEPQAQTPHDQILAKLQFIGELVDTLIHMAEQKDNPLASAMTSRRQFLTTGTSTTNTSSPYRRAEQLVVYVRALHMLSSALLLAQTNVANHVLHPSVAVQQVLNQLNDKYHQCLTRTQELASLGVPSQDPSLAVITVEKIMYKHAIDLCQAAALDELFGNPHLCSQRYQTAHMMLHTLSEQVNCDKDKMVLSTYKTAVEKRLRILEQQGFVKSVTV